MPAVITTTRVLDVRRFGAKLDDTADDTTRIQQALDEFTVSSGTPDLSAPWSQGVLIPRGRARITSPLLLKPGTRLWGESAGSAQIRYAGADNEAGALRLVPDANSYVSDVCVDRLTIYTAAGSGIFLGSDYDFAKVVRDNAGAWSDKTTAASQVYDATFDCFAGTDDWLYCGSATTFGFWYAVFSTLTGPDAVWDAEYWNGTSWADLTKLELTYGYRDVTFAFTPPGGWAQTNATAFSGGAIADATNRYYIRVRLSTAGADATQSAYIVTKGWQQPLALRSTDLIGSCAKTVFQLMKGYTQNAHIVRPQWRDGGADLIFCRGNHNFLDHANRETNFRGGGAQHVAFIRMIGQNVRVRGPLIEGGGAIIPYHLGGAVGEISADWLEPTYANSTCMILDAANGTRLLSGAVPMAFNAKVYVNFSQFVHVRGMNGDSSGRATEFGIVLRDIAEDPHTRVDIEDATIRYAGGPHDPRIRIRRSYSTENDWIVEHALGPHTGNLIRNGDFLEGKGDEAGSTNVTITRQSGVTAAAEVVADADGAGSRLHLTLSANTGALDHVVTVTMGVGTLAAHLSGKPGRLFYRALTSPDYDGDRPVVLITTPNTADPARSGGGELTIFPEHLDSTETISFRWYVGGATSGELWIWTVGYIIGVDDAAALRRQAPLTAANGSALNTGDATSDTVIGNMRTRINELETRLQTLGLL
jgi:hypothetical protein